MSPATLARVRAVAARYPSRRSAVLPALWAVQDQFGYLPSAAVAAVAEELELVPSEVAAVSSFYSMYFSHKPGQHFVQVCRNVSCALRGADGILAHLGRVLGVEDGATTADGLFTLEGTVECLGGCGGAPMMQVDRYSYEDLTPDRCDNIIAALRAAPPVEPGRDGGPGGRS